MRDRPRVASIVVPAQGQGTAAAGAAGVEARAGGVVDAQGHHIGFWGEDLVGHRCGAGCCYAWGEDGVEEVAVGGGVEG